MIPLATQLRSFHDNLLDRAGCANAAVIERATKTMVESGVTARARRTGEIAPDFTLADQQGCLLSLSERLAHGPVALVFYRGGWSPLCELTLRAWQAARPAFCRAGGDILAVSPDTVAVSLNTATSNWLDFPLLSDTDHATITAYGLDYVLPREVQKLYQRFNKTVGKQCRGWRLPIAASYLIGRDRRILADHVDIRPFLRMEPVHALRLVEDMAEKLAA